MSGQGKDHVDYAHKVKDETLRYTQDVLKQNEKLRQLVAKQERDLLEKSAELEGSREALRRQAGLERMVALLEEQSERLKKSLLEAEGEALKFRRKLETVEAQLGEVTGEHQQFAEQYSQIEKYNTNLMNLYVMSHRLHESLDRALVLEAIRETIINLVGSEDFAVFELDRERKNLELATSFGLDEQSLKSVPLDGGAIGGAIRTGRVATFEAGAHGEPQLAGRPVLALVPLQLDREPYGAIAIFTLLPQKSGLEEVDFEIFDLLSTHAATALYGARLCAERVA